LSRTVRSSFFPSPSIPCATVTLHHRGYGKMVPGRANSGPRGGFWGAADPRARTRRTPMDGMNLMDTKERQRTNGLRGPRVEGGIVIFGEPDADTVAQIKRCAAPPETVGAVLCADAHKGYSMPIGGVVAYRGLTSPSGVGFDIGCGNKAVRTNLKVADVRPDLARLMDRIFREISFGIGRKNPKPIDH